MTQKRTPQIIIGIVTAAVLTLLAWRYPMLTANIPTKIQLDGSLSNFIPKQLFALGVAGGLIGFNAYLQWFRDPEEPLRVMALFVFLLICGGIVFSLLI